MRETAQSRPHVRARDRARGGYRVRTARRSRWVCARRGCSRCEPGASASPSICACWRCWRCCGCRCGRRSTPDAISRRCEGDKKRARRQLRFVLPRAIGDVEYGVECTDRSVRAVLARLRATPERFRARRRRASGDPFVALRSAADLRRRRLRARVGDVVRVPLGSREVRRVRRLAGARDEPARKLKPVLERLDVPRAFDETGLHLARFVAEHYICTLGEALGAVVLGGAVPRMRDRSCERRAAGPRSAIRRFRRVSCGLIWEELADGFGLEQLLRHPEARRIGDRAALLRHVASAGAARRVAARAAARRPAHARVPRARARARRRADPRHEGRGAGRPSCANARRRRAPTRCWPASPTRSSRAPFERARCANGSCAPRRAAREPPRRRRAAERDRRAARALRWIEAALDARRFAGALLYGVTGSGKTFVYVEAIERVVRDGRTRDRARSGDLADAANGAAFRSGVRRAGRGAALGALRARTLRCVAGVRARRDRRRRRRAQRGVRAVDGVRLIVVDEAHETSYKQETVPRYHAVAVARERMRPRGGVLVLGSATPSLESYAAAKAGRIALLELRERATAQPLPAVRVVDLRREFEGGNRRIFGSALVQALGERLGARREERALRQPPRKRRLVALPHLRLRAAVPALQRLALGASQRGAAALPLLRLSGADSGALPGLRHGGDARVRRRHRARRRRSAAALSGRARAAHGFRHDDAHRRSRAHPVASSRPRRRAGRHADGRQGSRLSDRHAGGVVAADIGLHLPDFARAERSFALIAQVCGRSGRARRGEAIVQTYAPEHPAIVFAAAHDYEGFAEAELPNAPQPGFRRRRGSSTRRASGATAGALRDGADVRRRCCGRRRRRGVGPAPYPIVRLNDEWRYRIALRARSPATLRAAIRERVLPAARADRATRLAINVDP